jgi:hypothetical protein
VVTPLGYVVGFEYQEVINEEAVDSVSESVSNEGFGIMKHCQVLT